MSASSFSRPQVIRGGLQAFEKFMAIEKARFDHAPVVLISGPPAPLLSESRRGSSSSSGRFLQKELSHYNHEPIEKAARQIELVLRHKLRLQTITTQQPASSSSSSSSYDFPTPSDVQHVAALADRVGASTLVAVGSGFHMDLAKAVAVEHKQHSVEQLVLVPTSLGAAQASTASHALLLDPAEEALLVQPPLSIAKSSSDEDTTQQTEIVIAQIDMELLDKRYKQHAILASLTVALDCIYRDTGDEGSIRTILEQAGRLLLATTNQDAAESATTTFAELSDLCYLSGGILEYGLTTATTRSMPLALAASLLPTTSLGQYGTTTLMAGLAPTYLQELERLQTTTSSCRRQLLLDEVATLPQLVAAADPPTLMVANESVEALLSHIHANQALWNCWDCPDDQFRAILSPHVLLSDG